MTDFSRVVARLDSAGLLPELLRSRRGIEKEALRVDRAGRLAMTPHPAALGAAISHPNITTDFAEALLELITPVFDAPDAALDFLADLHTWTARNLGEEMLWVPSMPCQLPEPDEIRIAEYGSSNLGRMKHIYRVGLSWRYGRAMQTIAGIHYNFSPGDDFWPAYRELMRDRSGATEFRSANYMALVRNFRRHVWLLIYLFGASPGVCGSFLKGRPHELEQLDTHSYYQPWATSLRMSGLGYQNNNQAAVNVCYNTLDTYIQSLRDAISTPHPEYSKIGVRVDGEYRQLNDSILQIENEYYSVVRPKRVSQRGERPVHALGERGIEYIEVRCLDLDPFQPLGIGADEVRFLDLFLWYCLLADSPFMEPEDCSRAARNQALVVEEGRRPGLSLESPTGPRSLEAAANELLGEIEVLAAALDTVESSTHYRDSVAAQREKIRDSERTPSGRTLCEMRDKRLSFSEFGMAMSETHNAFLRDRDIDPDTGKRLDQEVGDSIARARALEEDDGTDFESYLEAYFAQ